MEDQFTERWYQLCLLAAAENDPAKLLAMMTEINRLLTEKEQSLPQESRDEMRSMWRNIARELDRENDAKKTELNQALLDQEHQKARRKLGRAASAA
jgi:hypothetical protein